MSCLAHACRFTLTAQPGQVSGMDTDHRGTETTWGFCISQWFDVTTSGCNSKHRTLLALRLALIRILSDPIGFHLGYPARWQADRLSLHL